MAFFICDLHRHIAQLHEEQSKDFPKEFTVYRGQGMSLEMFEKMKKTKGGLLSFNNFLSTSIAEKVATGFVNAALKDPTSVGVLFIITVDPSISSAPFAGLDKVSYYQKLEKEILFSMQSIFRIGNINETNNNRLWRVHLTMTSDSDQQLNKLIERMREEIQGPSALYRLGALMIKLGEFVKAEEIYKALQERTFDELEKANLYYQLGSVNDNQSKYDKSLTFYQHALAIYLKHLSSDHQNIATCYNNIGLVYDNMNDYQKALPFYEKALEIYRKTLSDDHPNMAASYNSIGLVYNSLGDYSQALSFCKRALDSFEKNLPPTHPMLATSHNNIGLVYANMKNYSEAIKSHKRAVDIGQQTLPPNHPNLQVYKKNLESVLKKGKK
jgi:tetratricopeptide (TPR) repeat protein